MSIPKGSRAVLVGLAASMLFSSVVSANEFAYGEHANFIDGFKGNQNIRTDPPTITIMGFAHPAQIKMGNGNFVGIGTYKSKGTNAGTVNCPNQYDPSDWTGYADYVIAGVYNCFKFCDDCYQQFENPSFEILYGYCPAAAGNRWLMSFDGILRACIAGTVLWIVDRRRSRNLRT